MDESIDDGARTGLRLIWIMHRIATWGLPAPVRADQQLRWRRHIEDGRDDGVSRAALHRMACRGLVATICSRLAGRGTHRTALPAGVGWGLGALAAFWCAAQTSDDGIPPWIYPTLGVGSITLALAFLTRPHTVGDSWCGLAAAPFVPGAIGFAWRVPVSVPTDGFFVAGSLVVAGGLTVVVASGAASRNRPGPRPTMGAGFTTAGVGMAMAAIAHLSGVRAAIDGPSAARALVMAAVGGHIALRTLDVATLCRDPARAPGRPTAVATDPDATPSS